MSEERRRSQRVRLITQVECPSTGTTSLGRTENISIDGLLVLTPDTFEPETEVTVRFTLPPIPPGHAVESKGRVARTTPGVSMGIHLTELKEDDRRAIATFIEGAAS